MKKSKIGYSWNWLWVVVSIVLLSSACSSQLSARNLPGEPTPILSIDPSMPPSSTPIPPTLTPLSPTLTPTVTALPGPQGYLLTLDDLPPGFEWSQSAEYRSQMVPGVKGFYLVRYYSDGWLTVELTVAETPYENIPDGQNYGQGVTPVDTALVGQSSQAYGTSENSPRSGFIFIKGYVLVSLHGPISVDTALKLAQIMEARIPDLVPDQPVITFPEKLDSIVSARYFKPFALGKCTSDFQVSTTATVFSTKEFLQNCLQMEWASQDAAKIKKMEYAIYDLQNQVYIFKYSSPHGFGSLFFPRQPGNYEMRVAADDVLVAVLPFEMR